jgi:hypothetical protein
MLIETVQRFYRNDAPFCTTKRTTNQGLPSGKPGGGHTAEYGKRDSFPDPMRPLRRLLSKAVRRSFLNRPKSVSDHSETKKSGGSLCIRAKRTIGNRQAVRRRIL